MRLIALPLKSSRRERWRHAMKLGLLEQSTVDKDLRRFPVIPVQHGID